MTSHKPAVATVATLLAAGLALAPRTSRAQPLEPVDRPRTDNHEGLVQEQLRIAREVLDRLLEEPDADRSRLTAAFGHLGQLYLVYEFWRIARTALANAEKLDPTDARWPYYQAIANSYEGDDESAIAALDRVLTIDPDDLAARTRRAYALLDLDRHDEATAECRRILELDPSHSAAHLGLGRTDFEAGRFVQALEHFTKAIEGQPAGSAIHHRIGLALRRLGRREEAADHLERNLGIPVSYADPLYSALQALNVSHKSVFARGAEAMRTGNPDLALAAFEVAHQARPDDPETLFNVAMALVDLDDKPAAEARLREAIALDPDYREPHFNLALILAERNDFKGAEPHFRRAAEIDPDDLDARTRRGDILTRLGRADEAIEVLTTVLTVDAALPAARLALGAAHQASGHPKAARTALNRVLEAAPGAPRERAEAHYRLATLLETTAGGTRPAAEATASAESHLRTALELDAGFAEAHALLGRLLGQQERYAEAAGHFARALVQNPSNPGWHRDRAMALLLARRYAAARAALTSAKRTLANSADGPAATEHLDTLLARLLAACPDIRIRNGREALTIAQRLMTDRPGIENAETVAMAFAEIGDFKRAAEVQRQMVDEVQRRGGTPTDGQRQRLESYQTGEPVREPWFSP